MMKKQILIIAAMTSFLWSACGSSNNQRMDKRDSLMTDTNIMDSTVIDSTTMGRSTDTPALGTDNIRMDSMNNSSKH